MYELTMKFVVQLTEISMKINALTIIIIISS